MKKLKVILAVAMVIVLSLTMTVSVYAQDISDFLEAYDAILEEEQRRIDEICQSENSEQWLNVVVENLPLDTNVSTYPQCNNCNLTTYAVCAGEATLVDQGYHMGGFLGLVETDCYTYYYASRGAEMCINCGRVLWTYDQHDCLEVHTKCSKGRYSTCPMDFS